MALVVKDRVKETTSTTGTGTLTLGGAVTGFQTFTSVLSNSDTTYYAIFESSTGQFEVGLGTFTSSGTTLARTTILESSNSGNAINLTAGAADVFITQPAEKAVYLDSSGHIAAADGRNVTNVAASTATTAGTVTTAAQTNITSLGTLTTLTVDDITINGSTISDAGDLTVDVGGDIVLDCGGGDINLKDDGTQFGSLENDGTNFIVKSERSDADILFKVNDGGSGITSFTIDSSDGGSANFHRPRSNTAGDCAVIVDPSDTTVEYGFRIDIANNAFNIDRVDNTTNLLSISSGGAATFNSGITVGGDIDMGANQIVFNNNSQAIQIKDAAGTASYVLYQDNADTLVIGNGTNVEKIRLDTSGNENALVVDTSGDVTLGNNLYVPDQIIHSGDTDTYLQFHAANQFRIVTGGTEMFEVNDTAVQFGAAANLNGNNLTNVEDMYIRDKIYHDGDTDTYFAFDTNEINIYSGGTHHARFNTNDFITYSALKEDYDALSGTTPTIDVDAGGGFSLTTSGNTTFTFSSCTSGVAVGFVLQVTAGGSHTLTWPGTVDWAGGSAPDAPASGASNLYVFYTRDGGSNWIGVLSAAAYA
jgi:hypothetical protein